MDEGVQRLQKEVSEVEYEAEVLLLARQELVESDRARNGDREALTALRKIAKTSKSSIPTVGDANKSGAGAGASVETDQVCKTCGDYDGSEPVWFLSSTSDLFFRVPFHDAHTKLESDQRQLELKVKKLQSTVKDKTLSISNKGALADKIGPSLIQSLVILKDNQ